MEPKKSLLVLVLVYLTRWLVPPNVARGPKREDDMSQRPWPHSDTSVSRPRFQPAPLYSDDYNSNNYSLEHSQISSEKNHTWSTSPGLHVGLSAAGKSVEAASLSGLLVAVVQQELSDCDLVLVYDAGDLYSVVVKDLLLPNPRQVVLVRRAEDLAGVGWVSAGCGVYLLLLDHPEPLLTFAKTHHQTWDYHGRYVMVSGSVEQVEALAATRNGKKTEHILGPVKGGQEGEWRVYINMLYWGEGVRPVTTWRHHRFTSQLDLFPDKLSDLRGAVLKVSTFELAPSIMYYRADNGSLPFRYGEDIALTENLAHALNFSLHFAEPADGIVAKYARN